MIHHYVILASLLTEPSVILELKKRFSLLSDALNWASSL